MTDAAPDLTVAINNGVPTKPTVAMLMYEGMTMLDLIGAHEALNQFTDIVLVAASSGELVSDCGVHFRADTTFEEAPADVDVLFVPGGLATGEVMRDERTINFLADRGARARYVTSVCTGSLILGAAGLLRGYRATSHWSTTHLLTYFGAEFAEGRVVTDRNRITGGGVTAGIDFGLTLLAEMLGPQVAKVKQLVIEYDPAPPFDSGSPHRADPSDVAAIRQLLEPLAEQIEATFSTQ